MIISCLAYIIVIDCKKKNLMQEQKEFNSEKEEFYLEKETIQKNKETAIEILEHLKNI